MSNAEWALMLIKVFGDYKCNFCCHIREYCIIEDQHLGFHLGNAVKYISRAGRKDPARTVEDLRKAAWYLNRQIERLEMSLGGQNG